MAANKWPVVSPRLKRVENDAFHPRCRVWPIAGPPDVTFFNPATGRVHVAIGKPGVIDIIDVDTGDGVRTPTGAGAHTTAIVVPDRLYVISPAHGGLLVFSDE